MIYLDWQWAQLKCLSDKYKHKYSSSLLMLTHRAPPFVLKAWPHRPGKTWCDAYRVSATLPTHTKPLPPRITAREDELSSTKDELNLTGRRPRAGTQAVILARLQVSAPRSPWELVFPLPQHTPTAPRGKGATLLLSSQYLASSASL